MHFTATIDTDIGRKNVNQDSVLLKHAQTDKGQVIFLAVCDGLGGLKMGEVASATVIRAFAKWFDKHLPQELEHRDMGIIGHKMDLLLREMNSRIMDHGKDHQVTLGTTFTGLLLINEDLLIVHVGDSRVYHIRDNIEQLTADHTFVAREIARGAMSVEQAKVDRRRNTLLQAVGATENLQPQIIHGKTKKGTYLVCSDGFRHEVTGKEMVEYFAPEHLQDKQIMHNHARSLMHLAKERRERDNISVALVKVE